MKDGREGAIQRDMRSANLLDIDRQVASALQRIWNPNAVAVQAHKQVIGLTIGVAIDGGDSEGRVIHGKTSDVVRASKDRNATRRQPTARYPSVHLAT